MSFEQHRLSEREADLVRKAREGDEQAFDILHQRYRNKIFSYIFRLIGDRHQAEELAQETFLSVCRSIKRLQEDVKFKPWIYMIATNQARKSFREKKRSLPTIRQSELAGSNGDDDSFEIFEHMADESQRPDRFAYQKELHVKIQECLAKLPGLYRSILVMCDIEGMSYAEVAEILRRPSNSIGTWLMRARRKIRKMINLDEFEIKFYHFRDKVQNTGYRLSYLIYYQYQIDAFVDGELSEKQHIRIQKLATMLVRCRQDIQDVEKTKIILGYLPLLQVSPRYDRNFQEKRNVVDLTMGDRDSIFARLTRWLEDAESWLSRHFWLSMPSRWAVSAVGVVIVTIFSIHLLTHSAMQPVIHTQGLITTYNEEQQVWTAPSSKKLFQKNQIIHVNEKSRVDFAFADIYGIRIRDNSKIHVHDMIRNPKHVTMGIELEHGHMFVKLGKGFASKTLQIGIGGTQIIALGTSFSIQKEVDGPIDIALVEGHLLIRQGAIRHSLKARERVRIHRDGRAEKADMDLYQFNAIVEELNSMAPDFKIDTFRIKDVTIHMALPKTAARARNAMEHFLMNVMGEDKKVLSATLDLIKNTVDPDRARDLRMILSQELTRLHPQEDFSLKLRLYLASHAVKHESYHEAIQRLTSIVAQSHEDLSPLAQCMIALIYEEKLNDRIQARAAYQKILDLFPKSLDVKEAQAGLERLGI